MRAILLGTALAMLVIGPSHADTLHDCYAAVAKGKRLANNRSNAKTTKAELDCKGDRACIQRVLTTQQVELAAIKKKEIDDNLTCQTDPELWQAIADGWSSVGEAIDRNKEPRSHIGDKGFDPNPPAQTGPKPVRVPPGSIQDSQKHEGYHHVAPGSFQKVDPFK